MPFMLFGLNWIDGIIIVLLVAAVVEGVRIGVLSQIFVIAGFFGALFLAGWLFPHLLPIHDRTIRTIVNAILVLLAAAYAAVRSFDLGQRLHWSFRLGKRMDSPRLKLAETVLGGLPALAAALAAVWLLGVAIGRMPFVGFSNSASDSLIVQRLTRNLPPVPAVFAQFDRDVDTNAQPNVLAQPRPYAGFDYSASAVRAAAAKAAASVVRVTSFGCGGIVSGSGFAAGQGLVATNAHVIAGVTRPIIKYNGSSFEGVPVYFDPNLDLAILRVQKLPAPSLALAPANIALNTSVAILGYPGGDYHAAPGIVRDTRAVSARSIYDQGAFGRGVYEVQAGVDYGSSGSPVVLANGQAAGIIFSKSTEVSDIAYALTSVNIAPAVHKAAASHTRVSTGACLAD